MDIMSVYDKIIARFNASYGVSCLTAATNTSCQWK